ncbi:MAG: hypothetical protein ACYTEQ_01135 [Planctomycetota bacterium]|jgi:hypothetical protein
MAKQSVQDTQAQRSSRTIDDFQGAHYGVGRTDQPDPFAFVSDFDFVHRKAQLRHGSRKNQLRGYTADVDATVYITISGTNLVGDVSNGTLSIYPVSDLLNQTQRYYTWDEVRQTFTWTSLQAKTWEDLYEGNR